MSMGFLGNLADMINNKKNDVRMKKGEALDNAEHAEGLYTNKSMDYRLAMRYYEKFKRTGIEAHLMEAYSFFLLAAGDGDVDAQDILNNEEFIELQKTIASREAAVKEEAARKAEEAKKNFSNLNIVALGKLREEVPAFGSVIVNTLNARGDESNPYSADKPVIYKTKKRQYTHVDCSSLEEYTNSYPGKRIDGVIWMIEGKDGVTDFAREQVALAEQVGVEEFLVFVNCPIEMELEDLEVEIEEVLYENGYPVLDVPVVFGKIKETLEDPNGEWGDTIIDLLETMDGYLLDPED